MTHPRLLPALALATLAATTLGALRAGAPTAHAQDREAGPALGRGARDGGAERGTDEAGEPTPEATLGNAYFEVCDYDENGWISFREASAALDVSRTRFFAYDRDRDGRVLREEFLAVYLDTVRRLGAFQPPTPREGSLSDALPESIKPTASGEVLEKAGSLAELFGQPSAREDAKLISPLPPRIRGPVPHFLRLDLDRDGRIRTDDLLALLRPVQLPVRINTVIATLDADGDGGLDADELRGSMQND
ncbi:MAG: hypothetical protein QF903_04825 [Planctomycetota bacterium]|jgi:hypothetical protein|nr:hypothetical protein [Planctomycetota bacterium]MDP6763351.1 hypothetical protein [Planctomycetota bacterium]MDP6988780.1 hypothetical protein [Planctomycetota bacterium]